MPIHNATPSIITDFFFLPLLIFCISFVSAINLISIINFTWISFNLNSDLILSTIFVSLYLIIAVFVSSDCFMSIPLMFLFHSVWYEYLHHLQIVMWWYFVYMIWNFVGWNSLQMFLFDFRRGYWFGCTAWVRCISICTSKALIFINPHSPAAT